MPVVYTTCYHGNHGNSYVTMYLNLNASAYITLTERTMWPQTLSSLSIIDPHAFWLMRSCVEVKQKSLYDEPCLERLLKQVVNNDV